MPEKSYTPAPIRHLIQSRVEARSGFGPSLSGTAGILLVTALILGTLTCATPPPADHSSVNASGIIRIMRDVGIDPAALNNLLNPSLQSLQGPAGRSFEICVYGHSRGRELFRYSGDESALVENHGENMNVAVLIRIIQSGRTTRVLFAEASGEEEKQLLENIAGEILIRLNAAGFRSGTARGR
ncbi:MAG: hypothetical protein KBA15_10255 [Spirochaetes bacterium]|jgi:hypothetical protein|nr:hypothetical protein [Spirochaetota bacterium]